MSARNYSFRVGSAECAVLLDGVTHLGAVGIVDRFPEGSEADYRQAYADAGFSLDEAESLFNILVAKIGGETILVDTGQGGKPSGGHLPDSLQLAGLAPQDITLVVITHTHGDHVMGLLSDDAQPVFPNATYVISNDELAFWQGRMASLAGNDQILAMMDSQGLRQIDMDEEIMAGMTAVPIPGHTPGQIGLLFESEGEKLLHLADLLHSPMQFAHPEWSPRFDDDASVAVPSRRKALAHAADENTLALFYHLSFPGLGHITRAEQAFAWHPTQT